MSALDLTPFGFTPTETASYSVLLDRGPSSGYAVAKALSIARANAYQALDGLVSKGAAVLAGESPRIYRATSPESVLAAVARQEARKLEDLESQVRERARSGAPSLLPFRGERELQELVLRTAARDPGPATFLARGSILSGSLPVWRKRAADGAPTALWALGEEPERLPLPIAGTVDPDTAVTYFGADAAVLATDGAAVLGRVVDGEMVGYWSSDPLLIGAAKAALNTLTA
jgi:predicted DNA-binding transcriptional regulator